MSMHDTERDLDDFVAGRSDLSRHYRADAADAPPVDVDRAVLAMARAAIADTGASAKPAPRAGWPVPFALAATVLLAMVVWRNAPQELPVVVTSDVSAPGPERASASPGAPAAPAPSEAVEAGNVAATFAERSVADATPPPPAPAATASAQRAAPAGEGAPVVASDRAASGDSAEAVAAVAAEPPVAAARLPATAPAEGGEDVAELPPVVPGAVMRGPQRMATLRAASEVPAAAAAAPGGERSPEAWLADIRALRAAGDVAAADTELARFDAAYPDYFTGNPDVPRP